MTVVHPVTEEFKKSKVQIEIIIRALNSFDIPKVVIQPNNDAGSREVRLAIENSRKGECYIYANLSREIYLSLLKNCECIVGDSSSGLLEAPTFQFQQ